MNSSGATKSRVLVGRAAHCDVVINDPSISSEHARLTPSPAGWVITNLLSTNGTFVNNKRATTVPLKHGDHVRMGRIEFVFEMPDGAVIPSAVRGTSAYRGLMMAASLALVAALAAAAIWTLL